jgi:hypothetical protein
VKKNQCFLTQFGGLLFHPDCKKEKKKTISQIGPEFAIDQMTFMILGLMKCAINY